MVNRALETTFPNLSADGYEITSPATDDYNCIAWAAGVTHQWWWPDSMGEEYWPAQAPRIATIVAFCLAYQTLGYQLCTEVAPEVGFEKIAIYARTDGTPTHAARQLPDGRWTSKLGSLEDISHKTPDGVSGEVYGQVVQILKRPLPTE